MQDVARDMARQTVPWKEGQSWWVVGIEAVIALIIGIYIVADPVAASDIIRILIALVLLVVSAEQIVEGFRSRTLASAPWSTLRGGIGTTVGVLTILSAWTPDVGPIAVRQMLALGLLAYGVLGIVSLVFVQGSIGSKISGIIADVLTIVLGILLLTANPDDTGGARLLGAAAIIGGIALLAYAYMLWRRTRAPA